MARYVLRRTGGALVSLIALMLTGFFLFRILPGDPVTVLTRGRHLGPGQLAELRHQFGLDKPLTRQFADYALRVARGDLGTSFEYRIPVRQLILQHLGATVYLAGTATVISVALGLWLGTRSAWRPGSLSDRINSAVALTLWSVPQFWLGLMLIVVLAAGAGPIPGIFPTGGINSPGVTGFFPVLSDELRHLALPCLTYVATIYAQILLIMRASLLDEKGSDYLTTARAKGLRDALVLRRHAVPNALLPVMTQVSLNLGAIISSTAILVETVFSWPGLGTLFYQALSIPDQPLLEGLFLFFSASVIVMNLAADLLYPLLDPRVRTA